MRFDAAWVPEYSDMSWGDAQRPAIEWVLHRARDLGLPPALVSNTKNAIRSVGPLGHFATRYDHCTPRSGRTQGPRVVLAYVPTREALHLAMRIARDAALCVIEGFNTSLSGWASQVGASDLLSDTEAEPIEPGPLAEAVEDLAFVGNNGYADDYGKRDARRILTSLRDQGLLEPAWISGAVLGTGRVSGKGADRLHELAVKVAMGR